MYNKLNLMLTSEGFKIIDNRKFCSVEDSYLDLYKTEDITYLNNAVIDASTGIVSVDNSLIKNSLLEYVWWTKKFLANTNGKYISEKREVYKEVIEEREMSAQEVFKEVRDEVVLIKGVLYVSLLHPFGWYAFGHVYDTLFKLFKLLNSEYKSRNICFLLSSTHKIVDFNKILKILAGTINFTVKVRDIRFNERYICDELLLIKPLNFPIQFPSLEIYNFVYNSFYNNLKNYKPSKTLYNKVFLTRVSPENRRVLNYESLHKTLTDNNVTILYGNESLEDIFYIFNNATHVCGYHGSLSINTMFCKENTLILEYCSKNRIDTSLVGRYGQANKRWHKLVDVDEKHNTILNIEEVLNFYKQEELN